MRHRRKFSHLSERCGDSLLTSIYVPFCHFRCEWVVAISKMYLRHYLISTTFSHHRPHHLKEPTCLRARSCRFLWLSSLNHKGEKKVSSVFVSPSCPSEKGGVSLVMEAMLWSELLLQARNGYAVLGQASACCLLLVPCLCMRCSPPGSLLQYSPSVHWLWGDVRVLMWNVVLSPQQLALANCSAPSAGLDGVETEGWA